MGPMCYRWLPVILLVLLAAPAAGGTAAEDLRLWLENMFVYHNYNIDEAAKATGLSRSELETAIERFGLANARRPARKPGDPLVVLPYPGGRHPRIGFLDGAIDPMRGTKFSVFLPWPDSGYIVVDLPEAIWANGELIFLAHTHIPTVWDKKGVKLADVAWTRKANGALEEQRELPDGVEFGMRVQPDRRSVDMELWIRNGSSATLTNMRAQVCVMLKGAPAFNAQTEDNKLLLDEAAAVRSPDGQRWIATVWGGGKPWQNPDVPCIHSDPQFPDCPPGQTVSARGRIFFHEGPLDHASLTISTPM